MKEMVNKINKSFNGASLVEKASVMGVKVKKKN